MNKNLKINEVSKILKEDRNSWYIYGVLLLYMEQRFETISAKKIAGKRMIMSFITYKPFDLWSSFMPERKKISNIIGNELYSIKCYGRDYFKKIDPSQNFEMWAGVEVSDADNLPEGMETMMIPAGLYAVFHYQGGPDGAPAAFEYIFFKWLPESGYMLDDRPHFEVLGEKYKRNDPESEEDFYIPVRKSQDGRR